jgi:hypothetical protein
MHLADSLILGPAVSRSRRSEPREALCFRRELATFITGLYTTEYMVALHLTKCWRWALE